jgi:two-component system OmpR family sensor kinase
MDGQRRLLHDVSHEMRSPLARLQVALGLARQQPEKLTTYLDRIQKESERMDQLVGEILTISRLEAGVMSSMDEEFDLDELISDVISDARFEAADSGHYVDFWGSVKSIIRGNVELLHRAIENIVRNAIRHTSAGTSVSIEARLMSDAPKILLQISDQGPGIPEKDLASIFDPFFRGSGLKTSDGHGLGLAFAKRVIEAHGGTISASNRRGGGLCIEIVLPVKLP